MTISLTIYLFCTNLKREQFHVYNLTCKSTKNWLSNFSLIDEIGIDFGIKLIKNFVKNWIRTLGIGF